jgi:hypothetical protein
MRPRRALRRLILEPALLVSLVDRSTPAQLVLDRTPWLCQFAQSHSRCFPRLRVRARNPLPAVGENTGRFFTKDT